MTNTKLFLSYARDDDEPFVAKLYEDLTDAGYDVWWDRVSMPSRALTLTQEIRDAIYEADRLIIVVGPNAMLSNYVDAEWRYAFSICKPINPILRLGDYKLLPEELRNFHCPDFRESRPYDEALTELISKLKDEIQPLGTLSNVPALPAHYLPRATELESLAAMALEDINQPAIITAAKQVTALRGMGGIGKSVMAAAFARDCATRRAFVDGVIWLKVGQTPNVISLLKQLGEALQDDIQAYENEIIASQKLQRILADKRNLIVLDDVWHPEEGQTFKNIVSQTRCRLLLTTRSQQVVNLLGAQDYKIDLLTPQQAAQLLTEWKGGSDPKLPEIAEQLGYLPLALKIAGARLRKGLTAEEWLTSFNRVSRMKTDRKTNERDANLSVNIELSLDSVFSEEPESKHFYYTFGIFPDNITIEKQIVIRLWEQISDLSEFSCHELINEMVDLALIEEAKGRTVSLHSLLREYAREQLELKRTWVDTHKALLQSFNPSQLHWSNITEPYWYDHLSYHMIQAELDNELLELLVGSSEWMDKKFSIFSGDASYAYDVELAVERFGQLNDSSAAFSSLALLGAARHVVNYRAESYEDADLEILTFLERTEEALAYARFRRTASQRVGGFLRIVDTLAERGQGIPPAIVNEVLQSLAQINNEFVCANSMKQILIYLNSPDNIKFCVQLAHKFQDVGSQYELFGSLFEKAMSYGLGSECLELARSVEDEFLRARFLLQIATNGAAPNEKLVNEALEAVDSLNTPSHWTELHPINYLIQHQKYDEAILVANKAYQAYARINALCLIARHLVPEHPNRSAELLDDIMVAVSEYKGHWEDEQIRRTHMRMLLDLDETDTVNNILAPIPDNESKIVLMLDLVDYYKDKDPHEALNSLSKAQQMTSAIKEDDRRHKMVGEIACKFAEHHKLDDMENVLENVPVKIKVNSFVNSANQLYEDGSLEEATQLINKAIKLTSVIENEFDKNWLFSDIAVQLALQQEISQALDIIAQIRDSYRQAECIQKILPHLGDLPQYFDDLLKLAESAEEYYGPKILRLLALHLARLGHKELTYRSLDKATQLAERFKPISENILSQLVSLLCEAQYFEVALKVSTVAQIHPQYTNVDKHVEARTYREIAQTLARHGQISQAIQFLQSYLKRPISHDDRWIYREITEDLVHYLVDIGHNDSALELMSHLEDKWQYMKLLSEIAVQISVTGQYKKAVEILQFFKGEEYVEYLLEASCQIYVDMRRDNLPTRASAVMNQAMAAIYALEPKWRQVHILGTTASLLASLGDRKLGEETLNQAFTIIDDTADPSERAEHVTTLARSLMKYPTHEWLAKLVPELASAVKISRSTDSPQGYAIKDAAVVLSEHGFSDEALKIIRFIRNPAARIPGLLAIARLYVEQGRYQESDELVSEALVTAQGCHKSEGTAACTQDVAYYLVEQGQIDRALKITDPLYGENRPRVISNIAVHVASTGDVSQALEISNKLYDGQFRDQSKAAISEIVAQQKNPADAFRILGVQQLEVFIGSVLKWTTYFEDLEIFEFCKAFFNVVSWSGGKWISVHQVFTDHDDGDTR